MAKKVKLKETTTEKNKRFRTFEPVKPIKKKNPQDATLRNINVLKKKVAGLIEVTSDLNKLILNRGLDINLIREQITKMQRDIDTLFSKIASHTRQFEGVANAMISLPKPVEEDEPVMEVEKDTPPPIETM